MPSKAATSICRPTEYTQNRAEAAGSIMIPTTIKVPRTWKPATSVMTSMNKNSSLNVPAPSIGGVSRPDWSASVSADRDFDGGATSSQQNTLAGAITVTVAEVMPNGVLGIRGEKWIRLNQGDEYIRLGGMVRVEDIDQSNRISSQRIADARITYAGRGALADSNQMGWLSRFFSSAFAPL